jgi:hypothetical protein
MNKDDVYSCLLATLAIFAILSLCSIVSTKALNYKITVFHQGKVSSYDGNTLIFEDGSFYSQSMPNSIYANESEANNHYGWRWGGGVDLPIVIGDNYSLQRSESVFLWLFPCNVGYSEIRRVGS